MRLIQALSIILGIGMISEVALAEQIRISPDCFAFFKQYKQDPQAMYFALSEDGQSCGYSYCPKTPCASSGMSAVAVKSCQKGANGSECRAINNSLSETDFKVVRY